MLLRAATTFLMVFGLILSFGFAWMLQTKPHTTDKLVLEHYSLVLGGYLILTMLCFIGAAICAIFMVRQVKQEFLAQTRQNLDELVESALRTHQKSQPGNNE
jgi:hypothetical protein